MFKRILVPLIIISIFGFGYGEEKVDPKVAGKCMTCHKEKTPGLYRQWYMSEHAIQKVTCINCHGAQDGEPDAFMHEKALIATLVTPGDCGECHEKEARQVGESYHAKAGEILESQDAYLAHVAGGQPVAITGCESCHGAKIRTDRNSPNRLALTSWPNSGIGRLNPDGTKGACSACHTRHSFSKAQARQPESCSKCHLGPDHPQKEVYEESKHGNVYYTHIDEMNLKADRWIVGEDYYEAPTCATCHLSATVKQKVNHDVGQRISWTLRPVVSVHKDDWETRRDNMRDVCNACHGKVFITGHFHQFDATVRLYNEKFAEPATEIMNILKKQKVFQNPASFSNKIEWTYWELWHHEGRRARHGVSMMGPDYTWWHGIYEVAQHFYFRFIPEALDYDNPEVNTYVENLISNDPMHQWLNQPTDQLKQQIRSGEMQQKYRRLFEGQ